MNAAGAGSCDANAQAIGELGVAAGHECGSFFVAYLDETNLVFRLAKSFHNAVDAVAGKSEDSIDIPIDQGVYNYFGCCFGHTFKTVQRIKCNGEMTVNILRSGSEQQFT